MSSFSKLPDTDKMPWIKIYNDPESELCTDLKSNLPNRCLGVSSESILDERLKSAVKNDEEIRMVFDINLTLCDLTKTEATFFDGVLENFVELLKVSPVVCISGDQTDVIQKRFIPKILNYVYGSICEKADQEKILQNLTVYCETGCQQLTFDENLKLVTTLQPSAVLKDNEFDKITGPLITKLKENFIFDIRLEDIYKSGLTDISKPLTMQVPKDGSKRSVELSIYGIHSGENKNKLREIIKNNPALQDLKLEIVKEAEYLAKELGLNISVQLSGTSTIDFRRFGKDQILYLHMGKDLSVKNNTLFIAVADSLQPYGNDCGLKDPCSITVDVAEDSSRTAKVIRQVLDAINSKKIGA